LRDANTNYDKVCYVSPVCGDWLIDWLMDG
jgi:hypothetical protein